MEIQNCLNRSVSISKMAALATLLKFSYDISSQTISRTELKFDGKHK